MQQCPCVTCVALIFLAWGLLLVWMPSASFLSVPWPLSPSQGMCRCRGLHVFLEATPARTVIDYCSCVSQRRWQQSMHASCSHDRGQWLALAPGSLGGGGGLHPLLEPTVATGAHAHPESFCPVAWEHAKGKEVSVVILPLPSTTPNNGTLSLGLAHVSSAYTLGCNGIPLHSGCLCAISPSCLPMSDLWSPSFGTQSLPSLADKHLRLGSAWWWYWTPGQVSLCFALHKPVVVLSPKSLKLLFHPGWSSHQWGDFPGCGNIFLSQLPPKSTGPILIPFSLSLLFFFCHTWFHGDFLALSEVWGLLPVFSRCFTRIVPHIDVFLIYLWQEVSSTSCTSTHIDPPSDLFSNIGI